MKITKSKATSYIFKYITKDTKVSFTHIDHLSLNKRLHDNVLEAFFQSLEIDNLAVLTCRKSYNFFVEQDHVEMISTLEKSNYLIAPICLNNNHWTCVFIDLEKSSFYYFDPLGVLEENKRRDGYFKIWQEYYKNALEENSETNKIWKCEVIPHPKQAEKDVTNCGVFVCLFISKYFETNKISFDTKPSDLKLYRTEIENSISRGSCDMSILCSICGNANSIIDESSDLIPCESVNCCLMYHKPCLEDFKTKTTFMKKLSCVLCNTNF